MPLGRTVRRLLGPLEPTAIRLYRDRFIDLDTLAATIASLAPAAKRVLEIGCGDGAVAAALHRLLPAAELLGIDPGIPEPGRMFVGDRGLVRFEKATTSQLLHRQEMPFDLVLLVDVLHHVSDSERQQVLTDAGELTFTAGTLVVKEWELRDGLANRAAFTADRYVSGDASVRFMARQETDQLIETALPGWTKTCEARIPPRRANLFLSYRALRPAAASSSSRSVF